MKMAAQQRLESERKLQHALAVINQQFNRDNINHVLNKIWAIHIILWR